MDLLKHCGPDDIITRTGDYPGQNCEGWSRHMAAYEIRQRVGHEIWDSYHTFAMERNPWDKVISSYWYKRGYRHKETQCFDRVNTFERLVRHSLRYPWSFNTWLKYRLIKERLTLFRRPRLPRGSYWLTDLSGNLIVDSILRYEHRSTHLEYLANQLGLNLNVNSQEGRKTRKTKRLYTEEFNDWSREAIRKYFQQDLLLMNYEFGEPAPNGIIERQRSAHRLVS